MRFAAAYSTGFRKCALPGVLLRLPACLGMAPVPKDSGAMPSDQGSRPRRGKIDLIRKHMKNFDDLLSRPERP
tara:strand:- start:1353 stop:1571 length:219 start_codon:yes stop_codon:yes gene_type:complete